jgi:N-dimethylarginine dimethylaminohydrolase
MGGLVAHACRAVKAKTVRHEACMLCRRFGAPKNRALAEKSHARVIYRLGAFTPDALAVLHAEVAPADRIALERADAAPFAANAVCFNRVIVLSSASMALGRALKTRGYTVVATPLQAFQRAAARPAA